MDRKQTWAEIRALRADPPGRAKKGPRRTVFGAALQQAEELFRSSELLGASTRPINIFYGLSQATRAIASAGIADRNAWQLRGHGITHEKGFDRSLSSIQFQESRDARGSYTSLSDLLNSPRSESPVLLVDALASLPHTPAGASWTDRVRPLSYRLHPQGMDGTYHIHSRDYFVETSGWPRPPGEISADIEPLRRWALEHLEHYFPGLTSASPLPDEHPNIRVEIDSQILTLRFRSEDTLSANWQREAIIKDLGLQYSGQPFIFPRFRGFSAPQHPLMIWWACLWSFSMYARYEPSRWSSLIDVDTSPDAVGIETLLDDSLDVVPQMILKELKAFCS